MPASPRPLHLFLVCSFLTALGCHTPPVADNGKWRPSHDVYDYARHGIPNEQWVRCAAAHLFARREVCEPDCEWPDDYWPILDPVQERCGGSPVQPGGNALLVELWLDAEEGRPLPVPLSQNPSGTNAPALLSLAQAQKLAAETLLNERPACPRLFLPFDSGTQVLARGYYYLRVRCTDNAYLAIVHGRTGDVRTMTCTEARATIGNFCYTVPLD